MPCRPVVIAALRGYFRALAATDGPSLIHCAAGKDRTGVAVALFHTALGVHRDDIMADYLLTNVSGRSEQRVAAAMAAIRTLYGERLDEDAAHALVSAAPDYLEAAFAGIERGHGSVEAYLRDVLGVDAAWHEAAARRLIV
jgi:protein tyrosine/serine phosphatase